MDGFWQISKLHVRFPKRLVSWILVEYDDTIEHDIFQLLQTGHFCPLNISTGWWFGTFFIFPYIYIGNSNPN